MKRKHFVAISIALLVVSLALPAFRRASFPGPDSGHVEGGLLNFALGWTGIFVGVVGWFANPCYLAGMVALHRGKRSAAARWLFVVALGFALSMLIWSHTPFTGDAAGGKSVLYMMSGFYVWTASIIVALIGTWLPPATPQEPR